MNDKNNMHPCPHNVGVVCTNKSKCAECGWNPTVAEERLERIKQELEDRGKL